MKVHWMNWKIGEEIFFVFRSVYFPVIFHRRKFKWLAIRKRISIITMGIVMKRRKLDWKKVQPHVLVSNLLASIHGSTRIVLVHLRNIDASELEIVQFGLAFGKISNVLNLRKKNQVKRRRWMKREDCLVRHFCNSIVLNMLKQWRIILLPHRFYWMVDKFSFNFLIIKNWKLIRIMPIINKHKQLFNLQLFYKKSDKQVDRIVFFVSLWIIWSIQSVLKHSIK